MDDYYPSWLAEDLLWGDLPWDKAEETTMPAFLSAYTLHDSYWINLVLYPDNSAAAALRFDAFWTKGRVPHPGSRVADWPLLLILFDPVYQITSNSYSGEFDDGKTISEAFSQVVPPQWQEHQIEQHTQLGEAKKRHEHLLAEMLHQTVIVDIFDGEIEVLHGASVKMLCLSRNKEVLPLPNLPKPHSV